MRMNRVMGRDTKDNEDMVPQEPTHCWGGGVEPGMAGSLGKSGDLVKLNSLTMQPNHHAHRCFSQTS